ncbi:hypothetical protein K4039_14690 [Lyngbya sp. CCAP 1446/10]|uniref:hypothetical protein n=1 Tax=Lyngbya sp. CCAP 1446/10 TaxID=439293 RepID=UPI0022381BF2|nr:hypothetical protein [Lyngbya sp. CCAP 1446/10]MCW6051304.1 hypothetical protein [Lyngbya sp. CCAP 1446/10]
MPSPALKPWSGGLMKLLASRTELDRNQLLSQRDISEAFSVKDEIRMERDQWGLPGAR